MKKNNANEYIVDENFDKQRLDKVVTQFCPDLSRGFIQTLIEEENILVNNKKQKSNCRCKIGDNISVSIPELKKLEIQAENIPLNIVYEDEDLLVVNKENGMVVHPAAGHENKTLVNALLYHCKNLSGINGVERPGIVHRIDKETSGLLVVAKNDDTHRNLSEQLQDKTMNRIYIGIVSGVIAHNEGTIDAPIGRSNNDRKKMTINPNGKSAVTKFRVLERFAHNTLVEFSLLTGRTHQIRVHMRYIGYPLLGDPLYGHKKEIDKKFGQYLHAKKLGFIHPKTNKAVEFECEIPEEYIKKIEYLKTQ